MIEEPATVLEVRAGLAAVTSVGPRGCNACQVQGGCATASLARFFQRRSRVTWARNPLAAQPGDRVVVGLDERALLRAAWVAYALPLAGLLGGAVLGEQLGGAGLKELAAAVAGLIGFIVGLAWSRQLGAGMSLKRDYQAVILRVLMPDLGPATDDPGVPLSRITILEK